MARTLVLAGKIGPAFATSANVDGGVHIILPPVFSGVFGVAGYSQGYYDGMKVPAIVGEVLGYFAEDFGAFPGHALPTPGELQRHGYPAGEDGAFTMCTCPDGKQCNSCK